MSFTTLHEAAASDKLGKPGLPRNAVVGAYGLFAGVGLLVHHLIAEQELSGLLTLSALMQCLAFVFLALQLVTARSSAGISARTLGLEALAMCCRLSSTLWLNGYLPVDASGDWVYQLVDIVSLVVISYVLYQMLTVRRGSYQATDDSFNVKPLVIGSLVLAVILHADMDHKPLFDILWTWGLFIDAVAMVPQLWLISKNRGSVPAITSHYIATMAFSRLLSAIFWYLTMEYVACTPWIGSFNHGAFGILFAHAVHFLTLADFVYYYTRACLSGHLSSGMPLSCTEV